MGLFRAFDASSPPATAPPGCQAALGYLGGWTRHTWTLQEWLRFSHLRQAGIWVRDPRLPGQVHGEQAGRAAALAAHSLGWRRDAVFFRRVIWLDMELAVDLDYEVAFARAVLDEGYIAGDYRSLSSWTAVSDPPAILGDWIADWDDLPVVERLPRVIGHQYAADVPWEGTAVDFSVFSGSVLNHFGAGPRRAVA